MTTELDTTTQGFGGIVHAAARQWPNRVALQFDGNTWTFLELSAAVSSAAYRLARHGVAAGTRVALLIDNRPEYLIAQYALAQLGAVFITPNPYWTNSDIRDSLIASGTTVALHTQPAVPSIPQTVAAVGINVIFGRSSVSPVTSSEPAKPDAPCYVPFSSGTTGTPKAVVHTVASLTAGVRHLRHHLGLSSRDHVQLSQPLCHIFGTTLSAAAFSVGAQLTLFRRFDLGESVRNVVDSKATIVPLAGSTAYQLVQRNEIRRDEFASVRYFLWSGSAAPVELARQITSKTGVDFLCSYGMTEAITVAFNPVGRRTEWRLNSPGFATEGTEMRLAQDGELEVRGPSVAAGYWGADSTSFGDDGWFRTGDRGQIDDDGRLTILDRTKDMIKVSGLHVSPSEVEAALNSHPAIADAAVIGTHDAVTGESPVACVVPQWPVTSGELAEHLRHRLASYKLPRRFCFVDTLPRTAWGKLKRGELRAQFDSTATPPR